MKVAILAGGKGIRLHPETVTTPKPMVAVGGKPLLWHIMRRYSHFGFEDFAIALGYRGDVIKRFMMNYREMTSDVTVDFRTGGVAAHGSPALDWRVDLVETGANANTGARVRRLGPYLNGNPFMLTYGDGVSDVDLAALRAFHRRHGRLATLTAVRPPSRFGHVEIDGDAVVAFDEKPQLSQGRINGGFFVFENPVLDYIPEGEDVSLERDVLPKLAADGQLMAYPHDGFWHCMDTQRDRELLEGMWARGRAPWKAWD